MFVHPLARADEHLIQDFMLTKVAILLARRADSAEWQFELDAMDEQSEGGASDEHAFLFVYTAARYYVAVTRADAAALFSVDTADAASPAFFGAFTAAVAANDTVSARALWSAAPFSAEHTVATPAIHRIAFTFLDRLAVSEPDFVASTVADFLPDPYVSAPSVPEQSVPEQPVG
jgi:hypothetical protein